MAHQCWKLEFEHWHSLDRRLRAGGVLLKGTKQGRDIHKMVSTSRLCFLSKKTHQEVFYNNTFDLKPILHSSQTLYIKKWTMSYFWFRLISGTELIWMCMINPGWRIVICGLFERLFVTLNYLYKHLGGKRGLKPHSSVRVQYLSKLDAFLL